MRLLVSTWRNRSTFLVAAAVAASAGCGSFRGGTVENERLSQAELQLTTDYYGKGDFRRALDHARKAVDLDDENWDAHHFVALIFLQFCAQAEKSPDCQLGQAEKHARAATKSRDTGREARNTLGTILIHERKYVEAIAILEPLTKDPTYTSPHLAWGNYGWAQLLAGQVDAAITSLTNSVTNPRFCVGYYRLGIAYERKGKAYLGQAEDSLTSALSVDDPGCQALQDAWFARGRVRLAQGKTDQARADLEKCRQLGQKSGLGTTTGRTCAQLLEAEPRNGASRGGGS